MSAEKPNFTKGEPFSATIKEIDTIGALGGNGYGDVAIVEMTDGKDGRFPLPKDHSFKPGTSTEITPVTHHHESGGSLTTYDLRTVKYSPRS